MSAKLNEPRSTSPLSTNPPTMHRQQSGGISPRSGSFNRQSSIITGSNVTPRHSSGHVMFTPASSSTLGDDDDEGVPAAAPRPGGRTIFTAGRPPWYGVSGENVEPFVIGIAGGSASGKTTVAQAIIEELGVRWVVLMSMDSFYKALTPEQRAEAARGEYNFDHPDAMDFDCCVQTLKKLKEGRNVEIPIYDFSTHSRLDETQRMYGANVILFEGIMTFVTPELRDLMDLKVFVDTDSDIRLARRLKRDIAERGRDLKGVIEQYNKFVKPAFDTFIYPTIKFADVVVPRGADNIVALDLIVSHVKRKLRERGFNFREQLLSAHLGQQMPDTLFVVPSTRQIKGMHTIIRNKDCPRDEFIFYANRLVSLAIEYALSLMPIFEPVEVDTPRGVKFKGVRRVKKVAGVSVVRAGVTMELTLREVCKDIPIGKILIQTDEVTGEPALHYYSLPENIQDYYVILCDPTIATGAAALMAVRVLLDHGVEQDHITFLSLIAAPPGIHALAYAFPKVKIVTTEVDDDVNENFHILPGIGNFGDRYFGTGPSRKVR